MSLKVTDKAAHPCVVLEEKFATGAWEWTAKLNNKQLTKNNLDNTVIF